MLAIRRGELKTEPGRSIDAVASVAGQAHGNAHAAADAERRDRLLGVAARHLEQQGVEHSGTGSADGMAQGDRTAVDVHLLGIRSEEHTSELQSRGHIVCRLLLEKKK